MPIDIGSELRRPICLTLAGVATVGWLLFVVVLVSLSQESRQARDEAARLRMAEAGARSELESQRRASGSLADLQARIAASEQILEQLEYRRESAQAQLSTMERNLQTTQQRAAEAARDSESAMQRLAEVRRQAEEAKLRLANIRGEIATSEQSIAARTDELAGVDGRLAEARQQEKGLRDDLARITREAEIRTVELGEAERRLHRTREAEAAEDAKLATVRSEHERLATENEELLARQAALQDQLTRAIEDLVARNMEMTDLEGRLQAARHHLSEVEAKLKEARRQPVAPPPGEPALPQDAVNATPR